MKTQTFLAVAILSLALGACTLPTEPGENRSGCRGLTSLSGYCSDGYQTTFMGNVTDSASNPVPGVQVMVHDTVNDSWSKSETNHTGNYWVGVPCEWNTSENFEKAVYFERGEVKRKVEITDPFCKDRIVKINDWPTG